MIMKNDTTPHPTLVRTLEVGRLLGKINTQTDLTNLLRLSQAAGSNWSTRGVSPNVMLQLQELWGANATYLAFGTGSIFLQTSRLTPNHPNFDEHKAGTIIRNRLALMQIHLSKTALELDQLINDFNQHLENLTNVRR
jgi:hypothetical protein